MFKENKGVTIISLVLTIVILVILTSVSFTTGSSLIKNTRIGRILSSMNLVKAKAEMRYEEYQFSENEEILGTKATGIVNISQYEKDLITEKLNEENITPDEFDNWDWYIWNKTDLTKEGLDSNMLAENECFYVNYKYNQILYSAGTAHDVEGETIYFYSSVGLSSIYGEDID